MSLKYLQMICKLALAGLLFLGLSSCGGDEDPNDPVIAVAYEHKLHRSDLIAAMPSSYSVEDSSTLSEQIISKWISEKSVLSLAEKNLSEGQKDFSDQLDDYRNSLVIYAYERELVNQKLDTIVSDTEVEAFFNENTESFKLKNHILKAWFISVGADVPKKRKLKSWFNSDKEEDLESLDDFCKKYAERCFLNSEDWIYTDDLRRQTAIPIQDWDNFLRNNSYGELEENGQLYLLRVFEYRLRGEDAPLDLERDKVINLIINKRKADLVKKMREDAVTEAYSKGKVEWVKE